VDLTQLANLVDLMRSKGVVSVDVGGVRVQLGPEPVGSTGDGVLVDEVESERKAREERQRYEATLYRSAG